MSFARRLTQRPWAVGAFDIERLRSAGVSEEGVEQAITVAAFFNYFTRVADGTGVEFDYESPLPRIRPDKDRPPIPRPPRAEWPGDVDLSTLPRLPLRPVTEQALVAWRAAVLESDEPLSRRDRRVVGRSVALALCDEAAARAWSSAAPGDAREEALSAYAEALTLAPWSMTEAHLAPLRAHGMTDRALLHVIALTAHLNAMGALHHGLSARARR